MLFIYGIALLVGFALGAWIVLSLVGCGTDKPLGALLLCSGFLGGCLAMEALLLDMPVVPSHLMVFGLSLGIMVFHRTP
jgi:hypothetical protein